MRFTVGVGGRTETVHKNNVLYVSSLSLTVLSASRLADDDGIISFFKRDVGVEFYMKLVNHRRAHPLSQSVHVSVACTRG